MEPDFSGWATKAGLKCSDGRTILPNAFQHQDKMQVPLVWQHGHTDPENVLGHAILENRDDGVYAYCYFNGSTKALAAKTAVEHKDIRMMSIWANELIEKSKRVLHGAIREVSLVLSGANPGALIDNITIRHSDGDDETILDDEAIIYTGLELEHDDMADDDDDAVDTKKIASVVDTMNDDQKEVLHFLVDEALSAATTTSETLLDAISHAGSGSDQTVQDVYDSMSDVQKQVLHFMIGEALAASGSAAHSNLEDDDDTKDGKDEMKHNNVFDQTDEGGKTSQVVLSHSDVESIVEDAKKLGSFKAAVEAYAATHLEHGINDIDVLFPEAQSLTNAPDFISRRMEWVNKVLVGARKSPFSRIKTVLADITVQEARAKGYIKGTLKKEEFFGVAKRVTTPTTIYKKQKLDRDDIIDITDFDVVVWLKGEMRIMLDEELARAVLLGDGRAVDDEDKISETNIRPIATDHEVYVTTLTVPMDATPAKVSAAIDEIALHRSDLRGSGQPTMFTTESFLARMLLLKDNTGRKLYRNTDELSSDMRVSEIVTVEVMEEYPDIFAILVNMTDYVIGADQGGQVSMFDDFDIDYNQYKYLIETRASGALIKFKAAMVVRTVAGTATPVVPAAPTFNGSAVTIVNTPNVVYRNEDTDAVINAAGSPYAVAPDTTMNVRAEPASSSYYIEDDNDSDWSFHNNG